MNIYGEKSHFPGICEAGEWVAVGAGAEFGAAGLGAGVGVTVPGTWSAAEGVTG